MFAISGFPRIERFKSTLATARRCGEDIYATSGESLPERSVTLAALGGE